MPRPLFPRKTAPLPLTAGCVGRFRRFREKKNPLSLPGFEPRTVQLVSILTTLSRLYNPKKQILLVREIQQSVQRLATGWTVRGSNLGDGEIHRTGPGANPASYITGTGSFPGVKRPGRGVDHPPPSSAEVKERVGYTSNSPLGLRGLLYGELYSYLQIRILKLSYREI